MKIKLAIILLAGVLLTSCSNNSPEAVVKQFFSAVENQDFEKARSLATKSSSSVITMMEKAAGLAGDLTDEESNSITKVECEIEEDKGDCKCFDKEGEKTDNVGVKKVDGVWKVHMSKQDMMKDAADSMGDIDMEGAMDKLKDIDMDEAMKAVSESLEGVENMDEQLNELTDELKEKAVDVIDAVEDNLDEVKESLQE